MSKFDLTEVAILLHSPDYEDRFKGEYYLLDDKITKLKEMLVKYAAGRLSFTPKCSYGLLESQLRTMESYREILVKRAEIEGIKLKGADTFKWRTEI